MSVSTSCPALSWGHRAAVELCLGQTSCLRGQVALVAFALSRFLQAQACGGSCSHAGRSWCPEKAGLCGLLVEGVHRRGGMLPKGLGRHLGARFPDATASCRLHQSKWNPSQVQAPLCPVQKPISGSQGHFKFTGGCACTWLGCLPSVFPRPWAVVLLLRASPPAYLPLSWGSNWHPSWERSTHRRCPLAGLGLWAEGGNSGTS